MARTHEPVAVLGIGAMGHGMAASALRAGIPAGPPSVRERFVATVAALPGGRALPADFKPGKVVYAILMENGRQLTPDTLFPFSQATLAHAARILGSYGINVEVAAIPAA